MKPIRCVAQLIKGKLDITPLVVDVGEHNGALL